MKAICNRDLLRVYEEASSRVTVSSTDARPK
jgi:hypothetical protein